MYIASFPRASQDNEPAAYSDAILIEYRDGTPQYILIDGGPYYNFDNMIAGLKRVAPNLKNT